MKEDEKQFFIALLTDREFKSYNQSTRGLLVGTIAELAGLNVKRAMYLLEKWCNRGFWNYGVSLRSGWFEFDKLPCVYKEIYDEEFRKAKYNAGVLINEPLLKKSDPHGFDYTPISWKDFLELRRAAQIAANNIGYPVYLVGSALTKEVPRDIDVSVIIPIRAYQDMFGVLPKYQEEFAEYLANVFNKTFEDLSELHTCLINTHHLDIKICPDTWWRDKDKMLLASPIKEK